MSNYVSYLLKDNTKVFVEVEGNGGKSKIGFKDAFVGMRKSAKEMLDQFDDLPVEEVEIKFGLKSKGASDGFVICKTGSGVNYEITLKWKKASNTSQ
jgi:hypothetical protein